MAVAEVRPECDWCRDPASAVIDHPVRGEKAACSRHVAGYEVVRWY